MDSSDTPPVAMAAASSATPPTSSQQPTDALPLPLPPSGDTSPAVASEEIGMGLREIGDELLRFYTPTGPESGSNVRPATRRLDSGADATTAAEEEVLKGFFLIKMEFKIITLIL